jgi:hypothetical protein
MLYYTSSELVSRSLKTKSQIRFLYTQCETKNKVNGLADLAASVEMSFLAWQFKVEWDFYN